MPLDIPTSLPPLDDQIDPTEVRVAAVVGGQLGSAPARGFGLTLDERAALAALTDDDGSTAQTRNRIVNGAMQISQENGNTAGAITAYFMADQWRTVLNSGTAVISASRASVTPTPKGSQNLIRIQVTTADTSLTTTENLSFLHYIEGIHVADFQWGTANAKPVVLRFGFSATVSGTYCVGVVNGDNTRSYVTTFTYTSAGMVEYTLTIPGDTSGTWLTDTGIGVKLFFSLAGGPTYSTSTLGAWQAGYFFSATSATNGMGAVGTFNLFDVGFYLDPQNTGVAPAWEMPDWAEELIACQRYFAKTYFVDVTPGTISTGGSIYMVVSGTIAASYFKFPVSMRTNPSVSQYSPVTGATAVWRNISTTTDVAVVPTSASTEGCYVTYTGTDAHRVYGQLVANARM